MDISRPATHYSRLVCIASLNNHIAVLQVLASHGVNLNQTNRDGITAAWMAAYNGHVEVLHFLLEMGADINLPNNDGETPADIAARNGHLKVLKLFYKNHH